MSANVRSNNPLVRAYALALYFYPPAFRAEYEDTMLQCLRDALRDKSMSRCRLIILFTKDLIVSLLKENAAMVKQSLKVPALVFNALVLVGISTILAFALYAIPQQVLRQGLNDPQIQMAETLTAVLNKFGVSDGLAERAVLPSNNGSKVDMAQSLAPFLIVYDDAGKPLGSTGVLNGSVPAPPKGVFDFVRTHGEERVSWQPILSSGHAVRIAAVIERVNGPQPGFVLAGRNMREVEARESQVAKMAGLAWLGMLGLIAIGTLAFAWFTQPGSQTAPSPAA